MAVVQLSKIQIRRGQKNTGSGLPQLASGELGWAIDTRELYIGNGAVSEGAPAVGNTKILTQYDDLFSLANTYSYKQDEDFLTGPNSSNPVQRTLQERLDDRVSVRAFGAVGDGVADDTTSIQRAIDQLYLSSAKGNPSSRIELYFEAGTYKITDTIYIPANATLLGAGKEKTVLDMQAQTSRPVIKTVNDSSTPGNPADQSSTTTLNQPRNIVVQGFTLQQNSENTGMLLESCVGSIFRDIVITGTWSTANTTFPDFDSGIKIDSLSGAVSNENNLFENCSIKNFSWGIRSDWDIKYNTFRDCEFVDLGYGIGFGIGNLPGTPGSGQATGPVRNSIENSQFTNISRYGIEIQNGERNVSKNNSFINVGNNQAGDLLPAFPVVRFLIYSNVSQNDWFSRTRVLGSKANKQIPYVPEIEGAVAYELAYEQQARFENVGNLVIFRLPGYQNQTYELDYTLTSDSADFIRSGTLTITMLDVPSGTSGITERVVVSDNYSFVGNTTDDIVFEASLQDLGTYQNPNPGIDTIAVRANTSTPGNIMRYTVRAKKTFI